ncbi:MAG: efflux RND transporter periplasmic adaptor subunit [Shimia sp.]|uniref:efflux RND transporter periplasmic adaptor subunit n=1 Tax=Shimia sp. TaxID=1954381 RepID=UPI004058E9EE
MFLISAAIVAAAWFYTFGLPWQSNADDPLASAATAGQPAGEQRGAGPNSRGGTATIVTMTTITAEPFTDAFRSVGTAKAKANVTVESETAGKVTDVHFGANQQIVAGDPLISIEDRVEQIALRAARANLSEARATLKRCDTLRQSGSGVISDVTVTEASTQVEIAEAALDRAEYDLTRKTIRAPISRTLGLTDIEVGMYLGVASQIVAITDQSYLTVEFGLPDRAAGIVKVRQMVRLSTNSLPGQVFVASVEWFDGQIDSTTRTIKVRARVDNEDGVMLPGMVFNVTLDDKNPPLPVVPANAITWSLDGAAVWVAKNNKAKIVPVAIRHREADRVWMTGDLPDGTLVIVEGVQKLREDAVVTTQEQLMQEAKSAQGDAAKGGDGN